MGRVTKKGPPRRRPRRNKRKRGRLVWWGVTAALALWHFVPALLAARGPLAGVPVAGVSFATAAGGMLTGARLGNVLWTSRDGANEAAFTTVDLRGGAPLGLPLTVDGQAGSISVGGVPVAVERGRARLEVFPDRIVIKELEASVEGRSVIVVGKGTVYPLRRDETGRAETHWECLVVSFSSKGLKVAETILELPLGKHRQSMDLGTDGLLGGILGKAVDLVGDLVGKWLGKTSSDYIAVSMHADPNLRVDKVQYLDRERLVEGSLEGAWRTLWSHPGLC